MESMWASPEVSDGEEDLPAHRAEERVQGFFFHHHLRREGKNFRRESRERAKTLGQMVRGVGGPQEQELVLQRALLLGPHRPGNRTVARLGVSPLEPDPEAWLCLLLALS